MKNLLRVLLVTIVAFSAVPSAQAGRVVVVKTKKHFVYADSRQKVWVAGHWKWRTWHYVWIPGHFVRL